MMSDTYEQKSEMSWLCVRTRQPTLPPISSATCDGSARLKNGIFECYTGRAKMQKTVTPSLTRSADSKTDRHGGIIIAALRCQESVGVCSFCAQRAMSSRTHMSRLKFHNRKATTALTKMWRRQRRRVRQRQRPQRHLRPKCVKSGYWFHVTAQHWCRAATSVSVLHVQIRLQEWELGVPCAARQ